MINLFRTHQKTLMLIVTMLVIIAFVWLYNRTQFEQIGRGKIGTLYDREITVGDLDRSQRLFQLGLSLGFFEWAQTLAGNSPDRMQEEFFFNSAVVGRELGRLKIEPSEDSILQTIRGLKRFQTNGQFDPNKYAAFIQEELAPRGFTEAQLEEVVRSALATATLKNILGSTVEVSPAEIRAICDLQFRRNEVSLIRIKAEDHAKEITLSEEEIAKAYEERKEQLKSDEKRKVQYVKLALSEEQAKLDKKERTAALQTLADQAQSFAESLLAEGATFDGAAAAAGLTAASTGDFTRRKPDPAFSAESSLVAAIFDLPPDQPDSDVIQSGDAFYVVRVAGITPAQPLSCEEARPQVEEALKNQKTEEKIESVATAYRTAIEEAMKAGKTFEQAAADAGAKTEKLPPFSMADIQGNAGPPPQVAFAVAEMKEGELSPFLRGGEEGYLAYLDKRAPPDEDLYSQEEGRIEMLLSRGRKDAAFAEWLRLRRQEAGGIASASAAPPAAE